MRIIVDGEDTDKILMELEADKRRKKPRKVVRRKTVRRGREEHVDDITSKVGGMKVEGSMEVPGSHIGETRSQPGSRRGSTLPPGYLVNPGEAARRASNASFSDFSRRGSQVIQQRQQWRVSLFSAGCGPQHREGRDHQARQHEEGQHQLG